MDETLRLCSQIQKTIADVDLLSEVESDLDNIDVSSVDGYSRTHSGVGSPESSNDMDDETFREQVNQLLKEARDYINDDDNATVEYVAPEATGLLREPSTSISLEHCDSTEMKEPPAYNQETSTNYSCSKNEHYSPSGNWNMDFISRKTNVRETGSKQEYSDKCDLSCVNQGKYKVEDNHSNISIKSVQTESKSFERIEDFAVQHLKMEAKYVELLDTNTDLKKEREDFKNCCKDLAKRKQRVDKDLWKASAEIVKLQGYLLKTTSDYAESKNKLNKAKEELSQNVVKISSMKTDMTKTKTELAKAKTELSHGLTELSELKSYLAQTNEASQIARGRIEELVKSNNELIQEKSKLLFKEENIEKCFRGKLEAMEKENANWQNRFQSLKQTLGTFKNRVDKFESEKLENMQELRKLNSLYEKQLKINNTIQLRCKSLMKERQELQSLCDEHEKMTNNVQLHCQSLIEERKELKAQCENLEKCAVETKLLQENKTNTLRKENHELQQTIKHVIIEKDKLKQKNISFQTSKTLLDKNIERLRFDKLELNKTI